MSWLHEYLILFSDGSVAPGSLYIGRGGSHIMCMWDYSMTSRLDPCCNIFYCLYIQMILVICCTHNYFLNPYLLTVILCESILACTNSKYLEYLFIWPWLLVAVEQPESFLFLVYFSLWTLWNKNTSHSEFRFCSPMLTQGSLFYLYCDIYLKELNLHQAF